MSASSPAPMPAKAPSAAAQAREAALKAVREVLAAARAQRGGPGTRGPVVQADVDLAAEELVAAGIRPHPQLLVQLAGGSFSTLTPMFEDWWQRFAARHSDPQRALATPLRATLHLRHLLTALENAARAELGLKDAQRPLLNALQTAEITALQNEVRALKGQLQARVVGESNALAHQVAELKAHRDRLQREIEAMAYQVSTLTTQLDARYEARRDQDEAHQEAIHRLERQFERIEALLTRPTSADEPLTRVSAGLERLRKQLGKAKPKRRPSPPTRHSAHRSGGTRRRVHAVSAKKSARRPKRRH